MRGALLIGALACAGLLWTSVSARQDTKPAPGFGTGIVKVVGTVDVGNVPEVSAAQRGEWRVAVANTAAVRVANAPTVVVSNPEFLTIGERYVITWQDGASEEVTVGRASSSGWIEVASPGTRKRWINLASARSVEQSGPRK